MALEKTPICSFGEKIYDFNLKSVDEKNYTLKDIVGKMEHSLCSFVIIAHMLRL